MLVHSRVTINILSLTFTNACGWRETTWSEVTCLKKQGASLILQGKRVQYLITSKTQTSPVKLQNLPPSVVMSQYTLNGFPVALGSIQYSPFSCAFVNFRMFSQEIPGSLGDRPSIVLCLVINLRNCLKL